MRIESLLPVKAGDPGVTAKDNRPSLGTTANAPGAVRRAEAVPIGAGTACLDHTTSPATLPQSGAMA